jgi:hypothetical protein
MKPQTIIDNYCRLYGVTMPVIDHSETQYFVTLSRDGAGVLYLHRATKLLGRVVGEAMKRGTVLYVHNGWVAPLTWEKWKRTWERLFVPKMRNNIPEPNRHAPPYRSEIFEEMKQSRAPKKPRKHGFARTFSANSAMNLLTPPLSGLQVELL